MIFSRYCYDLVFTDYEKQQKFDTKLNIFSSQVYEYGYSKKNSRAFLLECVLQRYKYSLSSWL